MAAKRKKHEKKSEGLSLSKPKKITTGLDPNLQRVILESREGKEIDPAIGQSAEDGIITVDVIAKLKDPQKTVPGLNAVRTVGQIITGTVQVNDIESVRSDDNIVSLKLATKLHKQLEFSVPEIQATQNQLEMALPAGTDPINGRGIIIGVIDYGCDFNHNNFRHADGATRLLFLWDQQGGNSSISPQGFDYGREFDANRINNAIQSNNPYQALAYHPGDGSHGTHVMDIAAGNGQSTGRPGVAPNADLIFVHISAGDISGEETFGNSARLLDAVDYIFTKADERGQPAVINISLGTHGGPHDGSSLVEQGLDTLLEQPNRAIVIAAGNSWMKGSHASGEVTANASHSLTWQIDPEDFTENELEVWYDGNNELEVTLITPNGLRLGPVALGTTVNITSQDNPMGKIIHRQHDPNNNDNHIDILLNASLPAGEWGVELVTSGPEAVAFHAWIERDSIGRNQSKFAPDDDDRSHTIGSISCGARTIAVGSYLSGVPDLDLSPFTAEGPTRDGKQKPEISAPGQFLHPFWEKGILAARSSMQGAIRMSGTSMAAPHVAGLIALLMQAAGRSLSITEIREAVINAARKNPPPSGTTWHPRYGAGRVDAVSSILTQLAQVPVPLSAPAPISVLQPQISNGADKVSVESLLLTLANVATDSGTRVRIQMEVEPVSFQESVQN